MGPDAGSAKWSELAWPGRTGRYDSLQQHEDVALLVDATDSSDAKSHGHHVPVSPDLASEEGQQQQHSHAEQDVDHGPFHATLVESQVITSRTSALLRPLKQLSSVVWQNGYVCMLVAAFTFSLSVLCVKLTGSRVPVLQITLARSTMSFIISAVLIKARGIIPMFGQKKHALWLIGRGVSGAFAMMAFYVAILKLPLADANTLFFLNPCMTAVAAWAILGEPLGLLGACGCLLSLLGLVVLTHPPMLFGGHADWGPQRVGGTLFGVVSAVGATGAFICIRFVGKAEPAIVVALYFHTSTMLMSALPLAIGFPQAAARMSSFDCLLLVGVAATSFFGQLSLTRGFQLLDAGKAAGLNFSQVLWGYAFGIMLFGEHLTLFGVLGTVLIAIGMGCVTARSKPQTQTEKTAVVRDLAGAGCGSVLLPVQQQQQLLLQNKSSGGSASFVARHLSFQRLLARTRDSVNDLEDDSSIEAGTSADHCQSGKHMISSGTDMSSMPSNVGLSGIAADTLLLQSSTPSVNIDHDLKQQGQRFQQQQQQGLEQSQGPTGPTSVSVMSAAVGDAELVPLGRIQHRHHSVDM